MRMIYMFLGLLVIVSLAYFMGRALGNSECRTRIAIQNADATMSAYALITKKERKINEQTNHTAVRDIRRILRERYTIAE